jgi:hypothetical protein
MLCVVACARWLSRCIAITYAKLTTPGQNAIWRHHHRINLYHHCGWKTAFGVW